METGNESQRNITVDVFRALAIFCVIVIHAYPFSDRAVESVTRDYDLLGVVLNQLARFAVPFFFLISGYFWGAKVRSGAPVVSVSKAMSKRLLIILGFWSVVYLVPYNVSAIFDHGILGPIKVWYWHMAELAKNPFLILFESTRSHLWFLIALLWAIGIATVFVRAGWVKTLMLLGFALYIFGTLALSYAPTPIGIEVPFFTLDGPFFGTVFFATGYVLSGMTPRRNWLWIGAVLAVLGAALHLSETFYLLEAWDVRPFNHYVFGTYFTGLGVALIALSNPPKLRVESVARPGALTLGVYAIHPIFIDLLEPLDEVLSNPLWEIGKLFLVYGLSVATVAWMTRHRFLKKVVA